MRPGVFYMTFAFEDEVVGYGFSMLPGCGDWIATFFEDESNIDEFDNFRSDLEEYGVHDVCGYVNPEVESVAFTTYEVAADKIPELMSKWRAYFVSKLGENAVGPVTEVTSAIDGDDLDIYYAACVGDRA